MKTGSQEPEGFLGCIGELWVQLEGSVSVNKQPAHGLHMHHVDTHTCAHMYINQTKRENDLTSAGLVTSLKVSTVLQSTIIWTPSVLTQEFVAFHTPASMMVFFISPDVSSSKLSMNT